MAAAVDDAGAPEVVLVEPVRTRLLQIAADVLGRMPADEVPGPLRAVARFTPSKRTRLGGPALLAALDADEDFRDRVAATVTEAATQLADALRAGQPTPASDPFDAAAVAYLTRPDGWRDVVAEATSRWTTERSGSGASEEKLGRLRAELAELRTQLRSEPARMRAATEAAASAAAEEATHLRNLLRARTTELRAAEDQVAAARKAADAARVERDEKLAKQETELRKLRTRVAELERSVDAARRETRAGRELDDARLRLLVDTLTEAAAGIRRELALPPGRLRPADVVDGAEATAGSAAPVDAAGLDRLLALPQVHVILDGYNVTKTGYPQLPLADQRARLIGAMAAVQSRSGAEVTIAFDGGARPPAQPRTPRGVRVLFSAPDEPADDLIRTLVAHEPAGRPLVVVTSDQEIVRDVRRAGARTVPSAVLVERLG